MFDPTLFLKSALIGMAIATPIGPMSLLCIKTALTRGGVHGLSIGLGIAIGDAVYAAVAALGLAGVSAFLLAHQQPLHLGAGLFLLWLGLKAMMQHDPGPATVPVQKNPLGAILPTVLLTLTNPPTILMFSAVFAALAPTSGFRLPEAVSTVVGVFAGSLLWWSLLVTATVALRALINARVRLWIDRLSGAVLVTLGLVELQRGFKG